MKYLEFKESLKNFTLFSVSEIKKLDSGFLFEIANKIHRPSYVSLEMALSYYHLIPESIYAITSVSSRRPGLYETPLVDFNYRKVEPKFFFGYELVKSHGRWFKIASLEKVILDYFYLNPHLNTQSDFDSLRINAKSFHEQIDEEKLCTYLERFSQKRLNKRISSFLVFIKNA